MLKACGRQLRLAFGGPAGLDFGAIIAYAQGFGEVPTLLFDVLPDVERVVLWAFSKTEPES